MSKQNFIKGTFILTCTGLASRVIGFFYRIFLSHSIGAQGLGLYQLMVPLQNLVLALTTSGIQTALNRLIASQTALKHHREAKISSVQDFLPLSRFLWEPHGFCIQIPIFCRTDPEAAPDRTSAADSFLQFSFKRHSFMYQQLLFCQKKTGIPSGLQLLEQLVRVSSSFLICRILISQNRPVTASIAAGGALVSELFAASAGLLLIAAEFSREQYSFFQAHSFAARLREICHTSFPLTLNRVLLTLLGSIEVVLIPQRLQLYGLSPSDSLGIYGVFTGMALPLILFPSTVTNSASVMLMPSVAEMQALGFRRRIRHITGKACTGCLLLGTLCAAGFFLFGPFLGNILFHSPTAGVYIRTMAFICPFLYMNTALVSILHGLGKNVRSLVHNAAGILIRISFVLFAVPAMGIRGYLYGILISEILLSSLHITALYRCE